MKPITINLVWNDNVTIPDSKIVEFLEERIQAAESSGDGQVWAVIGNESILSVATHFLFLGKFSRLTFEGKSGIITEIYEFEDLFKEEVCDHLPITKYMEGACDSEEQKAA